MVWTVFAHLHPMGALAPEQLPFAKEIADMD
jgi:hypothetical protein